MSGKADKHSVIWNSLSAKVQEAYKSRVVTCKTVMTRARMQELIIKYPNNAHPKTLTEDHLSRLLLMEKHDRILELIEDIQLFNQGCTIDLERAGLTLKDAIDHFEYGVFEGSKFPSGTLWYPFDKYLTPVNAWLFGTPAKYAITESSRTVKLDAFPTGDWEIFLTALPSSGFRARNAPMTAEPMAFSEMAKDWYSSNSLYTDINAVNAGKSLTTTYLHRANRYGIVMGPWDIDHGIEVYHLNHIKQMPDGFESILYDLINPINGSARKWVIAIIRSDHFSPIPYPQFRRYLWKTYPSPLRRQVFTLICMRRFHPGSFSMTNDVFNIVLDYVIFNFYKAAEEKIEEWKELTEKCSKLSKKTLVTKAADEYITNYRYLKYINEDHILAARYAAHVLGYNYIPDLRHKFVVGSATNITLCKKIVDQNGQPVRLSKDTCATLLAEIYDNKLCISLVRTGNIPVTSEGHIADLEEAIRLSAEKHLKDTEAAEKFRRAGKKPSKKKARVTLDNDFDLDGDWN